MNWLIERFQDVPERIVFIHEGREISYGTLVASTAAYRARIETIGIVCGQKVVVRGDYSPELFGVLLALAQVGCIIIPLTRQSLIEEVVALGISGCDWCIEFDDSGRNFEISNYVVDTKNSLLETFCEQGVSGLVLFSSGSTGKPKAILHDLHKTAIKFRKQRQPVVAIPFLMMDHFGGINTILAITSSLGTLVTVMDRSVANICSAIESYRVELLPATPTFLTLLMTTGLYRDYDLSSLKRVTYGTEVMPQATLDRVCQAFPGVTVQQTYGLSEVGVLHSKSRSDGSLWVRIGGDGFQTRIIDGILWIKSEYAMVGYLNAPSEFDAEGWFNTQDRVEVDGDYFRLLGRVTDIINVGGQKVYPAEVENVILGLDNIRDVAVYGERHNLMGQIVVAKVLLDHQETVESVKKRIRQVCQRNLTPYKVPMKVELAEGTLHTVRYKKNRQQ